MQLNSKAIDSKLCTTFLILVMSFPRAFIEIKLIIITLIIIQLLVMSFNRSILFPRAVLFFFTCHIIVGIFAALVGVYRENSNVAILDGIRLYIFWSMLIFIILTYAYQYNGALIVHKSVFISAIVISLTNLMFIGLSLLELNIYPIWLVDSMLLDVGLHDGYIQITSHNIGMLLFIVPYLLVNELRTDGVKFFTRFNYVPLFLVIMTAILSGRRALWIVILIIPYLMWLFAQITFTKHHVRKFKFFSLIIFIILFVAMLAPYMLLSEDTLLYLYSAFSSEDERSIQKVYLLDAFGQLPIIGSGFGGLAGYVRSGEAPWLFELTYHQMLLNFGLVGFILLIILYLIIFSKATAMIKENSVPLANGVLAVMFGTIGLLIGAYSNPYLGSFDYIVILGLLPFLISYKNVKSYNNIEATAVN